jgi:sarcosine oxidase
MRYDVAVLGLGGMGSSVLAHCAMRGLRAAGFEQYSRLHDRGSSSGRSRMIRKAYFEHPSYVPLLLRAYDAWRELERASNTPLLHITGLLMIGEAESELIAGALHSARQHELPVEQLDAAQVRRRFPMFAPLESECAVFERDGGYVVPEAAIDVLLGMAQERGAATHFDRAISIDEALESAQRVVVCAGAWLPELDPAMPIEIERNVQHWFAPRDDRFAQGRCPAFLVDRKGLKAPIYGFPDYGYGVKAAFHGGGTTTTAASLERAVSDRDVEPLRETLEAALPGAAARHLESKACMYALTPDRHFVLSPHPDEPRVLVAGGFSGHGFKFVPVIGEIVAAMLTDAPLPYDLDFLSARRFRRGGSS